MSTTNTKIDMSKVEEIAKNLNAAGIPPEFGADNSRLLIKTWRKLAQGKPITKAEVVQIAQDLGIPLEKADEFLRGLTERDADDNIVGLMGLSLNPDWAHRFNINGNSLRTWCAWDTLFLPALLDASTEVVSESPVSGGTVRLTVTPEGVTSANPVSAVVSMATIDPKAHDVSSIEGIWGNFCHQVYFFPTREEADEWAEGKSNIAILTVEEAFEVGRLAFSELRDIS